MTTSTPKTEPRLIPWFRKIVAGGPHKTIIALCAAVLITAAHQIIAAEEKPWSQNKGEKLYNGIVLPEVWPPTNMDPASDEPMPVPYLKHPPKLIPIDIGRQLFVDDFLVAETGMDRVFHKPVDYAGNPIMKPTNPEIEEGARLYHGGVWWNEKKKWFEMCRTFGFSGINGASMWTSKDLIKWDPLDLGQGDGNILFRPNKYMDDSDMKAWGGRFPFFVSFSLNQGEGDRYKITATGWGAKDKVMVMMSRTSPDLVSWSKPSLVGGAHDFNEPFYNPFRKIWGFGLKKYFPHTLADGSIEKRRERLYAEYDSFIDPQRKEFKSVYWTHADRLDIPEPLNGYPGPAIRERVEHCQLYATSAIAYESVMLGVHLIYRGPPNGISEKANTPKITEIEMGYSRDGFHWDRSDRSGFIRASRKDGTWNKGYLQQCHSICVILEDKLVFPYTGWSGYHNFTGEPGYILGATIGIASLRRDGFASMRADVTEKTLLTRPVSFSGKYMFVNVDNAGGSLAVEVLNEQGKVIPGFAKADCLPIAADNTKLAVSWKGGKNLDNLALKPVRFKFYLKKGDLYAFWVSESPRGESKGFLAGGGPGFADPRQDIVAK